MSRIFDVSRATRYRRVNKILSEFAVPSDDVKGCEDVDLDNIFGGKKAREEFTSEIMNEVCKSTKQNQ